MNIKRKRRAVLTAAAIILAMAAALLWLIYDSSENLQVTRYDISSGRLPSDFDGFRIVQLSDLHGAQFGEDAGALYDAVCALSPDIIALTGDFVTDEGDLEAVERLAAELTGLCPVYFVSGNHEFGSGLAQQVRDIMEKAGVKYLSNEFLALERGGGSIVLAGVEDPLAYADMPDPAELAEQLRAAYPTEFAVLLGHRNYWIEEYPSLPVDLVFCGHAHGGLVRLPGIGGLISTDRTLFPDYDAGLYEADGYTLIVSRGLGNSVPIPRILNRPEIVLATLHSK